MILWNLGGGFFDPLWNSGYLLSDDPMDGRSADEMGLRQL